MVILKNEHVTAAIDEVGAELKSLKLDGEEFIWEAKPEVWANASPILFPICGGLKNDSYTYLGKTYTLTKHGYAKFTLFEVERASDTEAVFLHISNEKTRAVYPFDYELRIIFTLTESGVVFIYQPYEVAPYSEGIISVEISDEELAEVEAPLLWVL